MRLSTKGRYGLLSLKYLVEEYDKRPVSISEMADRENLSTSYLEEIFSDLKKSGIVESVRGAKGGYVLSAPPKETTIFEVLEVLEGGSGLSCKTYGNLLCDKGDECSCHTEKLLETIEMEIYNVLKSYTLSDL